MSSRARRAATKRTIIDESDSDDVANATQKMDEESGDDFEPAPPASARRLTASARKTTTATTRKTTAITTTTTTGGVQTSPKKRGRPKKSLAPTAAVEPSEVFDPDQTAATAASEEPRAAQTGPSKRKSTAPRAFTVAAPRETQERQPLPTPKPSASPEPTVLEASPLVDMTNTTIHEQRGGLADETMLAAVKPVKAMDTILEKPMDIVLKSRNMAMPMVEDTGPKARIVITHLVMENFKSYAGRQEVGPFHASFSSVVGPNGSGKSNVIDSLLFVFGFRASKMRQGKLSALIHNSAQHPNLDHCEVAVHFQEVMDFVSQHVSPVLSSSHLCVCVCVSVCD